jgi:hypothetical protein
MPDLKALLDKHGELFDILSSEDGIYLIFLDTAKEAKKTVDEMSSFIEINGQFRLSDFFSKARLFLNYNSIRHGKKIYSVLGLEKHMLVTYTLESLNHSSKTLFGYALKGRGNEKGILGEVHGSTIGRNSVIIPEKEAGKIADFMDYWKVKFTIKTIYVDIQQKEMKK